VDIGTLFCDLTHDQTIAGDKTFSGTVNFTGTVIVPDASGGWTNDTSMNAVNKNYIKTQGYAPIDSPAFTGNPTAPTQLTSNNSTRIATTEYVKSQGYIDTDYFLTHSFFTTRYTSSFRINNGETLTLSTGGNKIVFNWGLYIGTIATIYTTPYLPASNCNNSDKSSMQAAFVRVSYNNSTGAVPMFNDEVKVSFERNANDRYVDVKNTYGQPLTIFVTMTQIG
jgi:hypothetical protein